MPEWKPTKPIPGPSRPAPIVHLGPPDLIVEEIELRGIQTPKIFRNADRFDVKDTTGIVVAKLEGLGGFAKGEEIDPPHWRAGRTTNYPVCLLRGRKVTVMAKLRVKTSAAVAGKITATPVLEGDASRLTAATVDFKIPAGAETTTITLELGGKLPMEVGRFQLFLKWTAQPSPDFSFLEAETPHTVFVHYDAPFTAAFDSSKEKEPGERVTGSIPFPSTVSGTPKRLDKLMSLLGPRRRHPATGLSSDLEDLLWVVHVGINDTPGSPPHFNPIHDEHLTHNGDRRRIFTGTRVVGTGNVLPLEEQWLMWVGSASPHWNAGSCIGHVQLAKTMLAAIGIFVRRSWILPKTEQMPDGSTVKLAESDLYGLGHFDQNRQQRHKFEHKGKALHAEVRLMEPARSYENFEACLRTPAGKFLPGGYTTAGVEKDHKGFIKKKGFSSAFEVLQWWCSTKRGSFQRFMCWVHVHPETEEPLHCWDRDGKHYDIQDYEQIFKTGKHLLPPKAVA